MVKTQDFQNQFTKDLTFTDKQGYDFLENSNLFGGELVLSNVGSIGKIFIVPKLNKPMTLAPNAIMIRLFNEKHLIWIYYVFQSIFGLELLLSISSATAIKKFNKTDFKTLLIPIPPLSEQKRIIDRIEQIEPLLQQYDKLEKQLTKLENEITDKLKKSILQYAIEGKLVKQDPNDEPASVLLERIKAEKEKLLKEGKIKRDKNESYIYQGDDKNYYEKLPKNWMLVPLSNIITLTSGTDLMPENYSSRNIGVPYLTGASNIKNNGEIIINRYTFKNFINSGLNDTLITCKGTIGKIAINTIGEVHIARQFMSVKSYINNEFMYFYLYTLVDNLNNNARSMIPGIDRAQILKQIVLIPPLKEQSRIVSRINMLFNIIK